MALNVSKEVEEQVIADRKEGMTLDELVTKYAEFGVTKNWVRRVVKDVKVAKLATSPQKAIAAILPLATRPIGVKPSEYFPILKEAYGTVWCDKAGYERLNITDSQKSYVRSQVKEKAAKLGKVAHFIPEWLDRNDPVYCNKVMLMCAQSLYDSFEEQVHYFLSMFPELGEGKGKGYSIRNELFALVVAGYDPSGVHNRCERNQEAVEFLTGNPDLPAPKVKETEQLRDEGEEYDTWNAIITELGY